MGWFSQNWIWVALGIGVLFFMTRMSGCGMGHSAGHHHGNGDSHHRGSSDEVPPASGNRPGNLFDPVSQHGFAAGMTPISTVYGGRAYYFENRENRDAFESDPEKYLTGAPATGQPVESQPNDRPQRRRHGC